MTVLDPPTSGDAARSEGTGPTTETGAREAGDSRLSIRVNRPRADAIVVAMCGEVDEATSARVDEVLSPRLVAAVRVIVLDLSGVTFLGVAGLRLLNQARMRAQDRDITVRLVATHHEVVRALRILELRSELTSTVPDALAAAREA